jgi:hypothetical protein
MIDQIDGVDICRSFVTGSIAYGIANKDSDCDLVILVSKLDMHRLIDISEDFDDYGTDCTTACLRFGRLNLIVVTQEKDFDIWKEGTEELIARRPVTREEAVAHFAAKRLAAAGEPAQIFLDNELNL